MKILKYISLFVVFLTILCGYSWMIFHASTHGNKLGVLSKPIIKFASFPQTIEEVLFSPEVADIPLTYLEIDTSFKSINKLNYDLYGLTSFWNNNKNIWEIKLLNLRTDSILYNWYYFKKDYHKYHIPYYNSPPKQIILLENKEILGRLSMSPNLFRMDANSNIIWRNSEFEYHHSLNLDADSCLWASGNDLFKEGSDIYTGGLVKNLSGELISLWENYIVQVDIESGETLFKKGVAKILLENGYKGILYGGDLYDPIHLNDIEPVLKDSKYWKKGDLFLSLRNRSLVLLYRPSSNKIIKVIQGPFINQHDVDILPEDEIAIFNNNYISSRGFECKQPYMELDSLNSSEIIIYNFKTNSFRTHFKSTFRKENIATNEQGLMEFMSNGDVFVEEHDDGLYHIINDNAVVMRKFFYSLDSNFIQKPNWMRLLEEKPF